MQSACFSNGIVVGYYKNVLSVSPFHVHFEEVYLLGYQSVCSLETEIILLFPTNPVSAVVSSNIHVDCFLST